MQLFAESIFLQGGYIHESAMCMKPTMHGQLRINDLSQGGIELPLCFIKPSQLVAELAQLHSYQSCIRERHQVALQDSCGATEIIGFQTGCCLEQKRSSLGHGTRLRRSRRSRRCFL